MGFLRILLVIIEVVTCLLLIGVILLQKSRDSGLGMAFGAGMGESLFGAQAGNILTRVTIILAAVFLVNTTLLTLVQPAPKQSLVDRLLPETAADMPVSSPGPSAPPAPADAPRMTPVAFPEMAVETDAATDPASWPEDAPTGEAPVVSDP